MTKGQPTLYEKVRCPACGKEFGLTYLARHMKDHEKEKRH